MEASRTARLRELAGSDTGRAGGMAVAMIAGNVIGLLFTIVFARVLGGADYGSLGALISTVIILQVAGNALQTTVAREVSGAIAARDPHPGAGVRRWLRRLVLFALLATVASILARELLATIIGVDDSPWAAAGTIPAGCLWLILSVERGALQGFQRYRAVATSIVAEQVARLLFGLLLVGVGMGVTGAFLGTALAFGSIAIALALPLHEQLGHDRPAGPDHRLRSLLVRARAPVAALALLAWLQDGHVIIVKHVASADDAGAWAAAAVAAKSIIWVGLGLSLYLVPEVARRSREGEDARPILLRTMAIIVALGAPMILIFAVASEPLLRIVFDLPGAADALPFLGLAMVLLALSFLATQFQLALHRTRFIGVLAVAAVVQPLALETAGDDLRKIALLLLAVQAAVAAVMITLALRGGGEGEAVEPDEDPLGDQAAAVSGA
jgi:O-antigen/teichoic acid export membrane protein